MVSCDVDIIFHRLLESEVHLVNPVGIFQSLDGGATTILVGGAVPGTCPGPLLDVNLRSLLNPLFISFTFSDVRHHVKGFFWIIIPGNF